MSSEEEYIVEDEANSVSASKLLLPIKKYVGAIQSVQQNENTLLQDKSEYIFMSMFIEYIV